MSDKSIIDQLQNDYHKHQIVFDAEHHLIRIDRHKVFISFNEKDMSGIRVDSRNGKNLYQAIISLIYGGLSIVPSSGTLAESLLPDQYELLKSRFQELAKRLKVGFIEVARDPSGSKPIDVMAVAVEDLSIIEEQIEYSEPQLLPPGIGAFKNDPNDEGGADWAILEEIEDERSSI